MQTSKSRTSLLNRILERGAPPDWSLLLALFFVAGFIVTWIAGQIIVSTLSEESIPSASSLAIGGLVGCVAVTLAVLQWARRRRSEALADMLHLRQPRNPPLFLVVLV